MPGEYGPPGAVPLTALLVIPLLLVRPGRRGHDHPPPVRRYREPRPAELRLSGDDAARTSCCDVREGGGRSMARSAGTSAVYPAPTGDHPEEEAPWQAERSWP